MPADASTETDLLLDATNLARAHGNVASLQDVSLQLHRGDVLALLGLNGAGKSTTLRLLSGVLAPDHGSVRIAGHSLDDEPLEARARLGYLPDQPPLYNDQRVVDYLRLAARLRRVPSANMAERVDSVIERCELREVSRRRIGQLSKGFRQRVGLAQALVHRPEVVLLDEPANGLDPQQMDSMRELIRSLGHHGTVIFSTHLLGEAQAVCNRVAVLHAGRLVADQQIDDDSTGLATLFNNLTQGVEPPLPGSAAQGNSRTGESA